MSLKPVLNKTVRRINLFGGPGIHKSTKAAELFVLLKKLSFQSDKTVELVREEIKDWAYLGRKPESLDQFLLFAQQAYKEDVPLRSGVDLIVSDSPLYLSAFYALKHGTPLAIPILKAAHEQEHRYPSKNLMLIRGNGDFKEKGRYHDQEESIRLDKEIRHFLKGEKIKFMEIHSQDIVPAFDLLGDLVWNLEPQNL